MNKSKDLESLMGTLLGKEVDMNILLDMFANYYNRSVETLTDVLKFTVITCGSVKGTVHKGIVSFEDTSLTINLDCAYNGYDPKYIVTNLC